MRRLQADELGQRDRDRSTNHESAEQRLNHRSTGGRPRQPDRQPVRGRRPSRSVSAETRRKPDDADSRRSVRQHAPAEPGQAGRAVDAAHRRAELAPEDDSYVLRRPRLADSQLGSCPAEREDRQRGRLHAGRQRDVSPGHVAPRRVRIGRQRQRPQSDQRNLDQQFKWGLNPQLSPASARIN